jgi:membrane protein YdbS with pleckstrin-like domain
MRVLADPRQTGGRDAPSADTFAIDPTSLPDDPTATDEDLWDARFSAKAMYGVITLSFAGSVAACIAALLLLVRNGPRDALLALALVPTIWLLMLVQLVRRKMRARYRLTPRRLVIQLGWLGRVRRDLPLSEVAEVKVRQNPIDRFLEVGSLDVCSRITAKHNLRLTGIDDPSGIADRILSRVPNRQPSEPASTAETPEPAMGGQPSILPAPR